MTGCSCSDEAGFGIAHVPTLHREHRAPPPKPL